MLAIGLLLALATGPAPAVDLRWDAPAGCPPQAELERQIAALLTDHSPADERTRVAFRVVRRGSQWHLHGEIHGAHGSGRRELAAATCAELAQAAALIVAIAVDPNFLPAAPGVPPPPPPAEPTPTEPAPPATTGLEPPAATTGLEPPALPTPSPAPLAPSALTSAAAPAITLDEPPADPPVAPAAAPRSRRPELLLGLSAGLGLGALPAPAGLLRLALGLQGPRWSASLISDFWLPRDAYLAATSPAAPAYGGRFWLGSVGLRGCAIAPLGRVLALPVCGALSVGVHVGEGIGAVTHKQRQISPWLGLAVGPGLQLRVSPRVRLGLALELLGILARPDFQLTGRGTVCCGRSLGAQFTAGVVLLLPGDRRRPQRSPP